MYHSLNLHFTSSFDVLKYGNKSKTVSVDSYNKRRDKPRFESYANRLHNERTAFRFCVANFVHNEESWFYGDYTEAESIYTEWKGYLESFEYKFKGEYKSILNIMREKEIKFDRMIEPTASGNNPPLMQLLLQGKITPEFVCTLNTQFAFLDGWYEHVEEDPFVSKKVFTLQKYYPLCRLITKEFRGKSEQ